MFDQGKSGKFDPGPSRRGGKKVPPAQPVSRQERMGFYADRLARALNLLATLSLRYGLTGLDAARSFAFSLSGQLLAMTFGFILIVEAVLVIPSLAAEQERWLDDTMRRAEIASQAIDTSVENTVSKQMSSQLLSSANVLYLAIEDGTRNYRLFDPNTVVPNQVMQLRRPRDNPIDDLRYLWAPWKTLMGSEDRLIHVQAPPTVRSGQMIQIVVKAEPLKQVLKSSLLNMLRVSLGISFAAGVLVFAALSGFIVRPIRRLTKVIQKFRSNPEDPELAATPSARRDEIGQIERELASMQEQVRNSLRSRARLAALGQAVSKINHDLRNMLTSARMASDRLSAVSDDPTVAKALPRLERALDRALSLATNVLTYGKSDEHAPLIQIVNLKDVSEAAAEDAGLALTQPSPETVRFILKASKGFHLEADPEQLHRLLVNLMRNARQAIELQPNRKSRGRITLTALKTADEVLLLVADNGPGIPEKIREKLFQPFTSSATPGGSGLGLAIARELAQIHGGDVRLAATGAGGTTFEIRMPLRG
ncbi:sensor histidine kinase [Asticcacaulis sp. AC402]|uniref:sensor histidine kinase n=1 Tax=Asticcacaulis sp. AC402 TaxID=1282361 RepID=UPI0003C3B94D|nr:HAMP domain-containing sensor histidine kinase [Asticcacaulis sp. AC402]ESQ73530.1 histidine kinase [Asticcacaulis sp. AC402]